MLARGAQAQAFAVELRGPPWIAGLEARGVLEDPIGVRLSENVVLEAEHLFGSQSRAICVERVEIRMMQPDADREQQQRRQEGHAPPEQTPLARAHLLRPGVRKVIEGAAE